MVEQEQATRKDFFISYTGADRLWAEWIAWQLEDAGYSLVFQSSFPSESHFVEEIKAALAETHSTLAVFSPDYVDALSTNTELSEVFNVDSSGEQRTLIPIQVRAMHNLKEGILPPLISYLDLVRVDEQEARKVLLEGISWVANKSPSPPFHNLITVGQPRFPGSFPPLWNVPYQRNPYFTGRDALMTQLAKSLRAGNIMSLAQPQAISGLGGIGKTQLALEYAYRYSQDYDAVFWVTADSRESLINGYAEIARILGLPQHIEHHQTLTTLAVQQWLQTHLKWLLILDNADDIGMVREFLPSAPCGHIILTTRAQSVGPLAKRLEVDILTTTKGALFLLRRAGLISPDGTLKEVPPDTIDQAQAIVTELGGLPLALDQAGAYIQETGCSLLDYINLYHARQIDLLSSRGSLVSDHPEPVATTWTLAFEMVDRSNPAAVELLQLCAFLAPDEIPLELITSDTNDLSPALKSIADDLIALNKAIATLLQYSLIRRDSSNKTLSMHRLVQAVLLDNMDEEAAHQWAERVVHIVSRAFPSGEFETWAQCDRLLPHALRCANWIEQYRLSFPDATLLLDWSGYYLSERGRYKEAEQLFSQALHIYQTLGEQHSDTARSLNYLAQLYQDQGRYKEAEPLYEQALKTNRAALGEQHSDTARSLNNLALLYQDQGRYKEAEPLHKEALMIYRKVLGKQHSYTATSLHNLARLYLDQDQYEEAEPLYKEALTISQEILGEQHPDTAASLNNLALLYQNQGHYEEAKPLHEEALKIYREVLGEQHPYTAGSLHYLARLYQNQGRYEEAESVYEEALKIRRAVLGEQHPDTATTLNDLAQLYRRQDKYEQAKPLYQQALAIREKVLGPEHHLTITTRKNLVSLHEKDNQVDEAATDQKDVEASDM